LTMDALTKRGMPNAWSLYVSLLAFFFLLLSCGRKDDAFVKPEGILSQDSMATIMTDIHLIEGAKVGRKIMGDTLTVENYYSKVYDKYGITKEEFEKNFAFYNRHPEKMDQIFESVIEKLNSIDVGSTANNKDENTEATEIDSAKTKILIDSLKKKKLPLKK